jgi:preprotein translocase subunit SecF
VAGLFALLRWELILLIIPVLLVVSVVAVFIYVQVLLLTIGAKLEGMLKVDVQTQDGSTENHREELSQL